MLWLDGVYGLVAVVAGVPWLLLRRLRGKKLASPRRRLGFVAPVNQRSIWVHGVSVGEVLAARALIAALRAAYPDLGLVITSTTPAGLEVARRTYPNLPVREAPYDFSFSVRRFVRRVNPVLLVLMEMELWPNLLAQCRRHQIPVVVANAKLSERSEGRYRQILKVAPRLLEGVRVFLAQDDVHAARLRGLPLGADVVTTGNLKFDNLAFDPDPESRVPLRRSCGWSEDHEVVLFGSTHAGEEERICEALASLRDRVGLRVVLAPRHRERVPEVEGLLKRSGFAFQRRTSGDRGGAQVLLLDTVGELASLYAMGDAAFVGGTLVPVGGHNLLEPAAFGLPLVVGPHLRTVQGMADALAAGGALRIVPDAVELAAALRDILRNPNARAAARAGAERVFSRHRGSTRRTLEAIGGLMARSSPGTQELAKHV